MIPLSQCLKRSIGSNFIDRICLSPTPRLPHQMDIVCCPTTKPTHRRQYVSSIYINLVLYRPSYAGFDGMKTLGPTVAHEGPRPKFFIFLKK
jgi:hypothetical protein